MNGNRLTPNDTRMIEVTFPLEAVSIDSVHEKSVRHGHLSTLHIWPARRPLAASRAVIAATLLPDPGDPASRAEIYRRLAGVVVSKRTKKGDEKRETVGGILHWGRESGPDLAWFQNRIREAYGGRPPRVLDPFAGGGAIPFEAMRLGCEALAADLNPVAWFILKCTLEYPQRLKGKLWQLPAFVQERPELTTELASVKLNRKGKKTAPRRAHVSDGAWATPSALETPLEGDLAAHVFAWGNWVLERARADLDPLYPNVGGKPTVAYLWARTVRCKSCRRELPLLKTLWLCKKDEKRVRLTLGADASGREVTLGIESKVAVGRGNVAQRREYDKQLGRGTMSRSGATCPFPLCGVTMTMDDLRREGQNQGFGGIMTAVVVDGPAGKEYRRPTTSEITAAESASNEIEQVFASIPFGIPDDPLPAPDALGIRVPLYGFTKWSELFTPRQLVTLGTFVKQVRAVRVEMVRLGYTPDLIEAVSAYLALSIDRLADRGSALCTWDVGRETITHTFTRFALPINWDFVESLAVNDSSGGYAGALDWIVRVIEHATVASSNAVPPIVQLQSATKEMPGRVDAVITDPPYYDAIPYSDLMDFFYVWLRRTLGDLSPEFSSVLKAPLSPKWDLPSSDGELIDDASRFGGDAKASKAAYEDGMYRAFVASRDSLVEGGRLVVVFANKEPAAWETLVSAVVRAGFVVDGSWPIRTELSNRTRAHASAALASSVWLVSKKRSTTAHPGWDTEVRAAMREQIAAQLTTFWDAGIRGPDFVWSAIGPALEAYSAYPIVKKADAPGEVLSVTEFLEEVRRIVVEFVVGRVLDSDADEVTGLDAVTTYYLLHRHDFKFEKVPVGASILYAISCGIRDTDLIDRYEILARSGGSEAAAEDDSDDDESDDSDGVETPSPSSSGSKVRLLRWSERQRTLRASAREGGVPLIDRIHQLMFLWKGGDQEKVDTFVGAHGLGSSVIFRHVLQALIELGQPGDQERALLEAVSNHIGIELPSKREIGLFEPA